MAILNSNYRFRSKYYTSTGVLVGEGIDTIWYCNMLGPTRVSLLCSTYYRYISIQYCNTMYCNIVCCVYTCSPGRMLHLHVLFIAINTTHAVCMYDVCENPGTRVSQVSLPTHPRTTHPSIVIRPSIIFFFLFYFLCLHAILYCNRSIPGYNRIVLFIIVLQ